MFGDLIRKFSIVDFTLIMSFPFDGCFHDGIFQEIYSKVYFHDAFI